MPDNVIDLHMRLASVANDDGNAFNEFLAAEGLELIAAFRSIQDATVRASVLQMLKALGAASGRKASY